MTSTGDRAERQEQLIKKEVTILSTAVRPRYVRLLRERAAPARRAGAPSIAVAVRRDAPRDTQPHAAQNVSRDSIESTDEDARVTSHFATAIAELTRERSHTLV